MRARGFYYLIEFLIGFVLLTGLLAFSNTPNPLPLEKAIVHARLNDALKVWAYHPPLTPEEAWEDVKKMFPLHSKTLEWNTTTFENLYSKKGESVSSEGTLYLPQPTHVKIIVYLSPPESG